MISSSSEGRLSGSWHKVWQKAEAAAQKQAEANTKIAQQEDAEWAKGAKSNAKKYCSPSTLETSLASHWRRFPPNREAAAAKAAEAAAKKAERDRLLAAEEASLPSKPKNTGAKAAPKKSKGTLDLSSLDDSPSDTSRKEPTINASDIDNALDALSLTTDPNSQKIERHPYARDLIQSIRDWTKVVDQAHRSLKPGGSFEVACEYLWPYCDDSSLPPNSAFEQTCEFVDTREWKVWNTDICTILLCKLSSSERLREGCRKGL
jgi:hypothetical protein